MRITDNLHRRIVWLQDVNSDVIPAPRSVLVKRSLEDPQHSGQHMTFEATISQFFIAEKCVRVLLVHFDLHHEHHMK